MKQVRQHLRGDSPQLNAPVLDRRSWPREPVRSPEASLSWSSRQVETTVDARVVNLSRGGAGLLVREAPPPDALLRLVLTGSSGVVVEGWAVAGRAQSERGWWFVHMKFCRDCPARLLERILDDSTDED
jgi:hypothetical protein